MASVGLTYCPQQRPAAEREEIKQTAWTLLSESLGRLKAGRCRVQLLLRLRTGLRPCSRGRRRCDDGKRRWAQLETTEARSSCVRSEEAAQPVAFWWMNYYECCFPAGLGAQGSWSDRDAAEAVRDSRLQPCHSPACDLQAGSV
ncbi:hypothetical protein AOLI_G00299880 [Acnodon oligacanthus]